MKKIFVVILVSFSFSTFSQPNVPALKKIVHAGVCREDSEICIERQMKYLKACNSLGDYYNKMKQYKKALKYFMLAAELGTGTDGELQIDKTIKLRNDIAEKAGYMYYNGVGTHKDIQTAFWLHHRGPRFHTAEQKDIYSKLYFNNTKRFYSTSTSNEFSDSVNSYGVNPFYLLSTSTVKKFVSLMNPLLLKMNNDTSITASLIITYGQLPLTMSNQADLYTLIERIHSHLPENLKRRISFDREISEESVNYKGFALPKLSITVKNR